MKLNRYFLALPFVLFSCSEVDESERLIYVGPAQAERAVLIEDFTGQKCVNCPEASTLIESLQETYGAEHIVAVGLHSGPMAEGTPLRTDGGDYLYDKYEVEAQPSGMINRGGVLQGIDLWGAQVRAEIARTTPLTLSLSNAYDEGDASLSIVVEMLNGSEDAMSGKLNVWLTEDGIVSPQFMPDGTAKKDYVHNHVFRAAVTPIDGEPVTLAARQRKSVELEAEIDGAWQPGNMTVVAFVEGAGGVLQAAKASVAIE